MRRILIIGGNRFMGYQLVWRVLAAGERVTTLNRGRRGDPFADRIERLHADRRTSAFADVLRGRDFDAVVDFAAFDAADVEGAVAALQDRAGHYVFISSGSEWHWRVSAIRAASRCQRRRTRGRSCRLRTDRKTTRVGDTGPASAPRRMP